MKANGVRVVEIAIYETKPTAFFFLASLEDLADSWLMRLKKKGIMKILTVKIIIKFEWKQIAPLLLALFASKPLWGIKSCYVKLCFNREPMKLLVNANTSQDKITNVLQ